ncbi:hypothetical protein LHV56_12470 [Peribacillus frigoritolerans]|uniref:hypothetical protein n=1 Tax=Peribacillus frigoritolerans TaxID=450367 RepID=UPI00207A8BC6|nr:hypothetical protein [Peribacillus frigoritolerans]USK82634.1 hypothetical protein LHV56_12470 [Peribacillus frigoritolerans]
MTLTLKDITYQDLLKITNEMKQKDSFFQQSFKGITIHFLQHFCQENTFKLSFSNLRNKFISISDFTEEDVPTKEDEFYPFICEEFFTIIKEPCFHFTNVSLEASNDLREIQNRKTEYKLEISSLNKEKPEGYRYKINQFDYLINKLSLAKEEIIEFLTNDIKRYSINKAQKREAHLIRWSSDIPYPYKRNNEGYTPEAFSIISNKFNKLSIQENISMKKSVKTNYEEFKIKTKEYISSFNIIDDLEFKITDNHRLSAREDIISEALDAYKEKKYATFCHVVAIQIEGIIFDYCLELEIPEKQIDRLPLEEKLKLIKEKDQDFLYFEYFAYNFPKIRNSVAHGRLIDNEVFEHLSDLLLLDLECVCNLLFSENLKVNKAYRLLESFNESDHPDKSCLYVIDYFYNYSDYNIPYPPRHIIRDIYEYAEYYKFWEYIEQHITLAQEISVLIGLEKVIKNIKNKSINEELCIKLLKLISQEKKNFNEDSEGNEMDFLGSLQAWDYPYL